MKEALKDFQKTIRKVRKEYQNGDMNCSGSGILSGEPREPGISTLFLTRLGIQPVFYSRYGEKAVSGRVKSKTVSFTAKISTSSPVI